MSFRKSFKSSNVRLPAIALFFIGIGICGYALSAESKQEAKHSLHLIFFESYPSDPPEDQKGYAIVHTISNDFPTKFSRLFMPMSGAQTIKLPKGVSLPEQPMFIDICTFDATDEQIKKQKTFSRRNAIQDLKYKLRFLSWSANSYQIELEGKYSKLEFKQLSLTGDPNVTEIIRVKYADQRTLFIAVTPILIKKASQKGITQPKFINFPFPTYPSALKRAKYNGRIIIYAIARKDGRMDKDNFVLLECPHSLFARNSYDVIFNEWSYHPAIKDGKPIDLWTVIEVTFRSW
jgi:hypothetical protein